MTFIKVLGPEHKHFIEIVAKGFSLKDAYISVLDTFRPEDKNKSENALYAMGSVWGKKFKKEIEEEKKNNFYKAKEERLETMASTLAKEEEITGKQQETGVTVDEAKQAKMAKLCANPLLVNQALNIGILSLLFDDIEIKEEGKKTILVRAIPNRLNWTNIPWVKDLVSRNLLNSEMFNAKVKSAQPTVANQVNVNVAPQ